MKKIIYIIFTLLMLISININAQKVSRYMGGEVELITAPNGAIISTESNVFPKITYTKPTTQKLADGVWCIGGYSLSNTTVIEGDDGLIVYDTGNTKELIAIFDMFDKFDPSTNFKVPPVVD